MQGVRSLVQPLIVLHIHPHGEDQRLEPAGRQEEECDQGLGVEHGPGQEGLADLPRIGQRDEDREEGVVN